MKELLSKLTIDEKMKLVAGKDFWHTEDFNGKLYMVTVSDGPIGLRKPSIGTAWQSKDIPAIAYPSTEVLAQTWNPELAYKTGECLADDCIELDVDVLLGPGVNIKRDPACGRNFEYFSEDPIVAGIMGREYIKGVQAHHVGTSLKHYCANSIEIGRIWSSSEVDERTLREIYLKAFEIACEADPTTVMSSYNLLNGIRVNESKKLLTILREEFGFGDKLIMSDWDAVKNHVASVKAGCDWEMPYNEGNLNELRQAYANGEITEVEIDACALRVLKFIEKCAENKKQAKVSSTKEERYAAAQKVNEEGIVLLKNNGVLPIQANAKVFITGEKPNAYYCGGGSSRVAPLGEIKTLGETLKEAIPSADVLVRGTSYDSAVSKEYWASYEDGYDRDVCIVVCGDSESEGDDRYNGLHLCNKDERMILQVAETNPNTVVVLRYGAAVDVRSFADKVAAIIWAGYGGERGNEALANILSGKVNPSGRLAETFAHTYEDYPCYGTHDSYMLNRYTEGLDVGYRYFDKHPEKVRYPFGFGLSYSKFEYSDLQVKEAGDGFDVCFAVSNVSSVDGADVPQVYVHEVFPRTYRPYKELKAFKKVFIKAGKSEKVCVHLNRNDFAFYSVFGDGWTVTPGHYVIYVGKNTQEICLEAKIQVK